jgi:hypothetical protein
LARAALFRLLQCSHKTLAQMNAPRPHFPTFGSTRPTARGLAPLWAMPLGVAAAGVLLSGCVGNPFKGAQVDPNSPVAADVARLQRQPTKFPSFASIPKAPTDIRPLAQYGRQARAVSAAGEAVQTATADSTWTLKDSEAFAAAARREAGPQLEPPTPGDAEAFAKELRQRATPPPPR